MFYLKLILTISLTVWLLGYTAKIIRIETYLKKQLLFNLFLEHNEITAQDIVNLSEGLFNSRYSVYLFMHVHMEKQVVFATRPHPKFPDLKQHYYRSK